MPPRENWPWEEKVSENTQIKLFSDEYHGVNCSLPSQSLDPIIPHLGSRSPSVSDTSPWWIDRDGLGKRRKMLFLGALLEACRCPDCSIEMSRLCFRKCQMCIHPFHSFILPLPHKTHLHFTKNLKNLNDFRLQVIYVTNVQNGNCKEAYVKPVGLWTSKLTVKWLKRPKVTFFIFT